MLKMDYLKDGVLMTCSEFGGLHCLVNNAGIGPGYGPFADLCVADIEATWAYEPHRRRSSALAGPCAAWRRPAAAAGGSIVNVSSRAAVIGSPSSGSTTRRRRPASTP